MSVDLSTLTPYPDVNAILGTLLSGVQAILGEQLVSMYLYGSLAIGILTFAAISISSS